MGSLTTQANPATAVLWGTVLPHKTAVRYTCRIDECDERLEPTRRGWVRLGVTRRFARAMDPAGQAKWWYFYHGRIPPERFTVELWGAKGYTPISGPRLEQIEAVVRAARDQFDFISPRGRPWMLTCQLKNPADESPFWLLTETHPADRFLVTG